jgi:hypothetical protein
MYLLKMPDDPRVLFHKSFLFQDNRRTFNLRSYLRFHAQFKERKIVVLIPHKNTKNASVLFVLKCNALF